MLEWRWRESHYYFHGSLSNKGKEKGPEKNGRGAGNPHKKGEGEKNYRRKKGMSAGTT